MPGKRAHAERSFFVVLLLLLLLLLHSDYGVLLLFFLLLLFSFSQAEIDMNRLNSPVSNSP